MLRTLLLPITAAVFGLTGCATVSSVVPSPDSPTYTGAGQAPADAEKPKDGEKDKKEKEEKPSVEPKPAKTLFEWSIGPAEPKDGDDKEKGGEEKEKPIDTDRPDFGVASTTVGKGRAVLETGYNFYHDRGSESHLTAHSYPDAVLRMGMFADWFEFRVGQTFANVRTQPVAGANAPVLPTPVDQHGAQDLYLGTKMALTEQKSFLPESALILQSTVPTGSRSLTTNRVLPGIIYLCGWDVVKDRLDFSGLFEADKVVDGSDHSYTQLAQTLEVRYYWTPKFRTFLEMLALYPVNATAPGIGPQCYAHPGVTYFVTDDVQLDFHVYIGLNRHATDYFGGPGLSIRY